MKQSRNSCGADILFSRELFLHCKHWLNDVTVRDYTHVWRSSSNHLTGDWLHVKMGGHVLWFQQTIAYSRVSADS